MCACHDHASASSTISLRMSCSAVASLGIQVSGRTSVSRSALPSPSRTASAMISAVRPSPVVRTTRCYVKLPNWFTVTTPVGDYNPD